MSFPLPLTLNYFHMKAILLKWFPISLQTLLVAAVMILLVSEIPKSFGQQSQSPGNASGAPTAAGAGSTSVTVKASQAVTIDQATLNILRNEKNNDSFLKMLVLIETQLGQNDQVAALAAALILLEFVEALSPAFFIVVCALSLRYLVCELVLPWPTSLDEEKKRLLKETERLNTSADLEKQTLEAEINQIKIRTEEEKNKLVAERQEIESRIEELKKTGDEQRKKLAVESRKLEAEISQTTLRLQQRLSAGLVPLIADPAQKSQTISKIIDHLITGLTPLDAPPPSGDTDS